MAKITTRHKKDASAIKNIQAFLPNQRADASLIAAPTDDVNAGSSATEQSTTRAERSV